MLRHKQEHVCINIVRKKWLPESTIDLFVLDIISSMFEDEF